MPASIILPHRRNMRHNCAELQIFLQNKFILRAQAPQYKTQHFKKQDYLNFI